jgi:hypothetical protein
MNKIIYILGLATAVAEALPNHSIIPAGLKYDGAMIHEPFWLLQFTEHDEARASHGATFYVEIKGFTLDKLREARDRKQIEFEAGLLKRAA